MSHWYRRTGNKAFRYTQTNKDGSESKIIRKGIALADGAVEGITSIIGRLQDQAWLQGWYGKLGIEAGLAASAYKITWDEAIIQAKAILKEESEAAANRGSEIHDGIEKFLMTGEVSEDKIVQKASGNVLKTLEAHGVSDYSCEHCLAFYGTYSTEVAGELVKLPFKFGGTTDLISRKWIWDWKTKEKDINGKYIIGKAGNCAQMAAYRHAAIDMGLCDEDAKCTNVYIDRITGDIIDVVHWQENQLKASLKWLAIGMYAWEMLQRLEKLCK